MPPTIVTGTLATDTINQSQRVIDMSDRIAELEPDEAPLVTLLRRLRRRKAQAPKVEWLEDESMPRFTTTSATAASNATAIPTATGNYFRVGDSVRNTTTGEMIEVTATASGAITATRAIGTVAAVAMGSGDELFIVGNVNAEGACLREIKSPQLTNQYNYTQIIRDPFGITGTEAATTLYGGPDRRRLQRKFGVEHSRKWEQTALVGGRKEDLTASGAPKRFAGGITEFVTTNITSAGGALTEATFQTFLRSGFRYGTGRKLLLASPLVISAIEGFARSNIQVVNDDAGTYGIRMRRYVSGQGEIDIAMERWMNDSTTYRGWAFLVDVDSLYYAPLRDTKLLEDRQPNDCDRIQDEYLTEATFVVEHERRHAILKGVTG
jgi:hypothetical protein